MAFFKPVDNDLDFPKAEEEVLKFWQDKDIFARQLAMNSKESCARLGVEQRFTLHTCSKAIFATG